MRAFWSIALACAACTHADPYVWADELGEPPSAPARAYAIRAGDLLSIRVWKEDSLSVRARVRDDGRITLPLVNDVEVAGLTPAALGERLRLSLRDFVNNPVVSVAVEETRPATASVVGEVAKPGVYPLPEGAGVLELLAAAGGPSEFANRDRLFVVRHHSPTVRIRFTYEALSRGLGRAAQFKLKDGDVLVVE